MSGSADVDFDGLQVRWERGVIEPRPWTVAQPRWLAELAADAPPGRALELFCGAGQMGLVLARETGRPAVLVDADEAACLLARANARAADLDVQVRCADVESALRPDERFALALVDPPWVPTARVSRFPDDPEHAIDGGADGLDVARAAVAVVGLHLEDGGRCVLQLGGTRQVDALAGELGSAGLRFVERRDHGADGVLVHLVRDARPHR